MKKLPVFICFALFLGLASGVKAQEKEGSEVKQEVKKGTKKVKKGAKKVGHKTAEVASKAKAEVTDQVYKDKIGPDGQTIYMDNHSRYYWVDDRGKRHYVKETELKDKP